LSSLKSQSSLVLTCNYHLRALQHLQWVPSLLSMTVARIICLSKLDYCNLLFFLNLSKWNTVTDAQFASVTVFFWYHTLCKDISRNLKLKVVRVFKCKFCKSLTTISPLTYFINLVTIVLFLQFVMNLVRGSIFQMTPIQPKQQFFSWIQKIVQSPNEF